MMRWLLLLCFYCSDILGAPMVLAHPSVPLDTLSQSELRNIFTLRQTQWPDGSAVRVIVLPEQSDLHQRFSRQQLKLFPYQLSNIWDKHSFSGTGMRPQQAADLEIMFRLLLTTPGAIGYAEHSAQNGLKELRIEN